MTIPNIPVDRSNIIVLDMFPITNNIYMNINLINENTIIIKLTNQYGQDIINTNYFCVKKIPTMTPCISIPGTKLYALDYNSKYEVTYSGIIITTVNSKEDWFNI
jgi:hypothetical protein